MNKQIYGGPYEKSSFDGFNSFMQKIEGVEFVDNIRYRSDINGGEYDIDRELHVYHLNGVTITYQILYYRSGLIIHINLTGDNDSVEKVEERLINARVEMNRLEKIARETTEQAKEKKF